MSISSSPPLQGRIWVGLLGHFGLINPPLRMAIFFIFVRDTIPDIIVIFAIFFFSFLLIVYYFVLFPGYLLGSCVRMASGHPAPHCPVSAVFRGLSCSLAPQCPVSASFASGFLLRSLAPHCMHSPFLGSYAGFNPASGSCFGLFTCRWLPAYFAANRSRAAFRAGVSFHLVGHRCTICCPLY